MVGEKGRGDCRRGYAPRETCVVSAATAARAGENSPGREPQCDPRARLQSRDRPESALAPLAPRQPFTPKNNRRLHVPECHWTGFWASAGRPSGSRNKSQRAVRLPARGARGSRPWRKWTGRPGQLEKERGRVPVFRGGGSPGWCRMEQEKRKSGDALVVPVHPHPDREELETKGPLQAAPSFTSAGGHWPEAI